MNEKRIINILYGIHWYVLSELNQSSAQNIKICQNYQVDLNSVTTHLIIVHFRECSGAITRHS